MTQDTTADGTRRAESDYLQFLPRLAYARFLAPPAGKKVVALLVNVKGQTGLLARVLVPRSLNKVTMEHEDTKEVLNFYPFGEFMMVSEDEPLAARLAAAAEVELCSHDVRSSPVS